MRPALQGWPYKVAAMMRRPRISWTGFFVVVCVAVVVGWPVLSYLTDDATDLPEALFLAGVLLVIAGFLLLSGFLVRLAFRGLRSRRTGLAVGGIVGLAVLWGGIPAFRLADRTLWAWRVEGLAEQALRESGDELLLGRLQRLQGGGAYITGHVWDIAGVGGRLVVLRTGVFDLGEIPVVIAAPSRRSAAVRSIGFRRGGETLLRYTSVARTPEGRELLETDVVSVVLAARGGR